MSCVLSCLNSSDMSPQRVCFNADVWFGTIWPPHCILHMYSSLCMQVTMLSTTIQLHERDLALITRVVWIIVDVLYQL